MTRMTRSSLGPAALGGAIAGLVISIVDRSLTWCALSLALLTLGMLRYSLDILPLFQKRFMAWLERNYTRTIPRAEDDKTSDLLSPPVLDMLSDTAFGLILSDDLSEDSVAFPSAAECGTSRHSLITAELRQQIVRLRC